jgi:phosphoglycolate phosphatase
MSKKMVVFDFDGTLVDAHTQFVVGLKHFSEARGLPWDGDKMGAGYTNPAKFDLGWGVPLEQQTALLRELNEFYFGEITNHKRFLPILFDGAREAIQELAKDYDLSIVTARDRKSLQIVLDHYELTPYFPDFRSLCCARDRGYDIKPAPDAMQCLLRDTGHAVEDSVVIGDTIADIAMANNAGAKSIAALWGVHARDRLASEKPTMMLENIRDLPQAVNELFNQ